MTLIAVLAPRARAQDAATQAQLDKITGEIQDVEDTLSEQDKRISALEKEISDLQNKVNTPQANNYASEDDLKSLAAAVQEIDRKRQEDNQKILDVLKNLGRGESRHPSTINPSPVPPSPTPIANGAGGPGPGGQQNGYYYTIAPGNTLLAIAKAYRAQGVKVTVDEILRANPGLNAKSLIVGQKIFIPAPQ